MPSKKFFRAERELKILQMMFLPPFKRILLRLNLNGITLNFKKCLFSKHSLLFNVFFSKEGIKPDRSKLEETQKAHTPKNAKHLRDFLGFPNYVKQIIPNYSTFKCNHNPLRELLQKKVAFD